MRAGLLVAAWLRCVAAAAASSRRDEMLGVLCALRAAPPRSDLASLQRSNPQHGCLAPAGRLGSRSPPVAVGYPVSPEPINCFDLLGRYLERGSGELALFKNASTRRGAGRRREEVLDEYMQPGREQALFDALMKEEGFMYAASGLFAQVNVATQLAFDAATARACVEIKPSTRLQCERNRTVSTRGFLPCFENSTRAIDSSKNQPNRLRFDRDREF
jgi:hypothetical protein